VKKNNKKKILYICNSLKAGGAEQVLINLLSRHDRAKCSLHLLLLEKTGKFLDRIPEDVVLHNTKKISSLSFLRIILKCAFNIYNKIVPDVVVGFLEYSCLVALISRYLSIRKPKVVITEHRIYKIGRQNTRKKYIRYMLMKIFYPKADRVIAVSRGISSHVTGCYGIKKNRIRIINNGIDIDYIKILAGQTIEEPGLFTKKDEYIIISCGRLRPEKNYSLLINAVELAGKMKKISLCIIGEGEQRRLLENLIQEKKMGSNVYLLGYKSNPFKYIARSDVFVLSSSYEGFGNILIEAMACGVPVVSTDCPFGPREIINHGTDGLLCPADNARALASVLLGLLHDKSKRKQLAAAGKKRACNFGIQKMVNKYENIYYELTGK